MSALQTAVDRAVDWLLALRVPAGSRVVEWAWEGRFPWWLGVMWVGAGAGAWWLYLRRREGRGLKGAALFVLRGLLFGLLAAGLTGPRVRLEMSGTLRQQVWVLVDASRSMGLKDERWQGADVTRMELVKAALPGALEKLTDRYDVRVSLFGSEVREGQIVSALPVDDRTALGDALARTLAQARGQPLAGIVLATDGGSNAGVSPLSAVAGVKVPVLAWGVGSATATDLAIDEVAGPETAFVEDEVTVVVSGRASGLEGKVTPLRVRRGEEEAKTVPLVLGADGAFSVPVRFAPKRAGTFALTVAADVLPGERITENNAASTRLRVIDGKLTVLYVERQPRWEFKYLSAALGRDRRVDASFVLLDGDASMSKAPGSKYLATVPTKLEELAKFDLVILGDVDPGQLGSGGAGGAGGAGGSEALAAYVERLGGAVVTIAGPDRMPSSWVGTSLERMLPVEIPAVRGQPRDTTQARKVELTPAGAASPMLRLGLTEADTVAAWKGLPGIYWSAEVSRARAASEVLLTSGDQPLLVLGRYGTGRTLFVGTEEFWRFRRNVGDAIYGRLWGQMVQGMALPHLLGEGKRTQLSAGKSRYGVGETAAVSARLFLPNYQPVLSQTARATLVRPDGTRAAVDLRSTEQAGTYQATVELPTAGEYKLSVDADPGPVLTVTAVDANLEMRTIAMNEPLLEEISRATGGKFLRTDDLPKLGEYLSAAEATNRTTTYADLISTPAYYLGLLGLACAEWWIRRKGGMK